MEQHTFAQGPGRLDQGRPCDLIGEARDAQATGLLKLDDGSLGDVAVQPGCGCTGDEMPGDGQSMLKIANRIATRAGPQDDGVRNSSNSCNSWPLPLAPTIRFRSSPSWNTSKVGMLMTLNRMAISP